MPPQPCRSSGGTACCGPEPVEVDENFGSTLYAADERDTLPAEALSNCVINLSTDKPAVFAETFRVLRPGGRIGVSDVIADDELTPGQRAERGDYVGCIAGALSFAEYRRGLAAAGFTDIEITPAHQVADGVHSALIRATKPAAGYLAQ